jgi:hypothetical protein
MGKPARAREWGRTSQLGEGSLKVFYDFGGDDVGIGQISVVPLADSAFNQKMSRLAVAAATFTAGGQRDFECV